MARVRSERAIERRALPLEGRLHRSAVLRLDAGAQDDGPDASVRALAPDPGAGPVEQRERRELDGCLRDALDTLPDRLRDVLVGGFLEGRSSAGLAQQLGVTESRVSQLRSQALTLVREGLARSTASPPPCRPAAPPLARPPSTWRWPSAPPFLPGCPPVRRPGRQVHRAG